MTFSFKQFFNQKRIAGGAAVLALTQLGASIAGLFRDRLLASTFPQLGTVDVYVAAFRPSDLLFQVAIMSALGTVLVPLLASHKAHGRKEDIAKLLSGTMLFGAIVFGLIALILLLFFPWIAHSLVQFEGKQFELYVHFAELALFTNFLFVFGNALGQFLITEQRYWIYGLTPILYTAGTIFGTVFLTPTVGEYGPMFGTVIGAVVYVLWRLVAAYRLGFRFSLAGIKHPELKEMGILMLPRMLALGALQIQLLFFDTLGSGLQHGAITVNYASRNFQSLLVGVVGIAIAQSLYSLLGQSASKKDYRRFFKYIREGAVMMLLLTVPLSIALVFSAPIAVRLVHLSQVYESFRACLIIYAISVPFESLAHLLLRAFYSLKDTVIPAALGVLSGFGAVVAAWWWLPTLGVLALPLGYLIGQASETVVLWILLTMKVRGERISHPTVGDQSRPS